MTELSEELSAHRPDRPAAVAFGVFDGVHRGHRHLLRALERSARQRGLAPVAVTLSNHPLSVLRPDLDLRLLTSLHERLALLRRSVVEAVAPISFSRAVSLLTARDFMARLTATAG